MPLINNKSEKAIKQPQQTLKRQAQVHEASDLQASLSLCILVKEHMGKDNEEHGSLPGSKVMVFANAPAGGVM